MLEYAEAAAAPASDRLTRACAEILLKARPRASASPSTHGIVTRNRLSLTALSMICRKLVAIERLRDCAYGQRVNPAARIQAQFADQNQ